MDSAENTWAMAKKRSMSALMPRTVSSVVNTPAMAWANIQIKAEPAPTRIMQSRIVCPPYCSADRIWRPPSRCPTREVPATEKARAGMIAKRRI